MLSVSNLLCDHRAGNEDLRYGHKRRDAGADAPAEYPDAPRPVVVWATTRACNLRCVHCYASAGAEPLPNELSDDESKRLLDDLRAFGVPAVLFSGGEPLMRPGVLELLRHAMSLGLACTLSTNGVLIDDAMADKLAELGLKYVGISLDGSRDVHDRLRGVRGAFDGSIAGINRCSARGLKTGVRFTVHALNEADLDQVFDVCDEHGVQRLCIYHLAYAGRGGKMQKADLTAAQTRDVVDRIFARTTDFHRRGRPLEVLTVGNHADAAYILLQLERTDAQRYAHVRALLEGTGGNRSGCNISAVDPIGNVHYDQFSWHYTCGNVREEPFSKQWGEGRDPRIAVLRNRVLHLPERCRECRFLSVCNGNLRTRAEAATGDWLGMDPSCYLTDEEVGATG